MAEAEVARISVLLGAGNEFAVDQCDGNAERLTAEDKKIATGTEIALDGSPGIGGKGGAVGENEEVDTGEGCGIF